MLASFFPILRPSPLSVSTLETGRPLTTKRITVDGNRGCRAEEYHRSDRGEDRRCYRSMRRIQGRAEEDPDGRTYDGDVLSIPMHSLSSRIIMRSWPLTDRRR